MSGCFGRWRGTRRSGRCESSRVAKTCLLRRFASTVLSLTSTRLRNSPHQKAPPRWGSDSPRRLAPIATPEQWVPARICSASTVPRLRDSRRRSQPPGHFRAPHRQSSPPARAGRNGSARAVPNGALMMLRAAPRPGRHGSSAAADGVQRNDARWARIADPRSVPPEAGPSRPIATIVAETTGKAEVRKGREMRWHDQFSV